MFTCKGLTVLTVKANVNLIKDSNTAMMKRFNIMVIMMKTMAIINNNDDNNNDCHHIIMIMSPIKRIATMNDVDCNRNIKKSLPA